jgi:hypothetical protein
MGLETRKLSARVWPSDAKDVPMISFNKIAHYVGAEPFRPFRVTTTCGRTFEIRHPEMIQVGRSTITIYTFLSNDPEEAKEQKVDVSLLLTESIEPSDAGGSGKANEGKNGLTT